MSNSQHIIHGLKGAETEKVSGTLIPKMIGGEKMNLGKKGKLDKGFLEGAVVFIVLIVLFLAIYAVLVPEAQTSGDALGDAAQCARADCFYNVTRLTAGDVGNISCSAANASGTDPTACASVNELPLSTLFGSTGVIFVVLMAALLIVLIGGALASMKKK